jgi:hypothetical protein
MLIGEVPVTDGQHTGNAEGGEVPLPPPPPASEDAFQGKKPSKRDKPNIRWTGELNIALLKVAEQWKHGEPRISTADLPQRFAELIETPVSQVPQANTLKNRISTFLHPLAIQAATLMNDIDRIGRCVTEHQAHVSMDSKKNDELQDIYKKLGILGNTRMQRELISSGIQFKMGLKQKERKIDYEAAKVEYDKAKDNLSMRLINDTKYASNVRKERRRSSSSSYGSCNLDEEEEDDPAFSSDENRPSKLLSGNKPSVKRHSYAPDSNDWRTRRSLSALGSSSVGMENYSEVKDKLSDRITKNNEALTHKVERIETTMSTFASKLEAVHDLILSLARGPQLGHPNHE